MHGQICFLIVLILLPFLEYSTLSPYLVQVLGYKGHTR